MKAFLQTIKTRKKKIALEILQAGLEAATPKSYLHKILKPNKIIIARNSINLSKYENVYLVAFGKAADSMAKTVFSLVNVKKGFVVIPKGSKPLIKNKKIRIFKSGHPIPDKTSVLAARTILEFLQKRGKNDFVIFLVSGGSSSLMSLPYGISLSEKITLTNRLLRAGATIHEINCVRKHLSQIKGGRLIQNLQCDGVSLVMSDVIDNDLSVIASGITYCDKTTYKEALNVIKKYNIVNDVSSNVIRRLKHGVAGKFPETTKKPKIKHEIIATNFDCLAAMAKKSKQLGIKSKTITISGDVKKAASKISSSFLNKKTCLIFGGETTVNVVGQGSGGRNQELVLRIFEKLKNKRQNFVVSSIGTDGIDGNTKYAGAIIDNIQVESSIVKKFLANNDSNSFFKKYGGLIKTGYTHTNLMDIGLIF